MAAPVRFERPRERLFELVSSGGERHRDLSRMVRRPDGYLSRFVRDGVPAALPEDVKRLLGAYYRTDPREFGLSEKEIAPDRGQICTAKDRDVLIERFARLILLGGPPFSGKIGRIDRLLPGQGSDFHYASTDRDSTTKFIRILI